jgi:hypothetical protein
MIKQLYLNLSLPGWIFFIVFWLLIILAIFYYWKTLPPLSKKQRLLLIILRSAILIFVVFLLFKPILLLLYESHEPPSVAILLDNSKSMTIEDNYGLRGDSMQYIIQNMTKTDLGDSLSLQKYLFDRKLERFEADSLFFSGKQTDISRALDTVLDSLIQYNIQAIVLVSDGQFNQGTNPLKYGQTSTVPIYTIPLGDSTAKKDLKISSVKVDRVAYVGQEVKLKANIFQSGVERRTVIVRLIQGKKPVSAQKIQLPPAGFEQELEFTIQAENPGLYRYTIEIEQLEDELTGQNNRSTFLLNVLKSKINVILISGRPSFDQQMYSFVLKKITDIKFSMFTENLNGSFYEDGFEKIKIDSQDVMVFLGYPTSRSNPQYFDNLATSILKNKIPLFMNMSSATSLHRLENLKQVLPLESNSKLVRTENVLVHLTSQGRYHPVIRLDKGVRNMMMVWPDLPPILGLGSGLVLKKDSRVLLSDSPDDKSYMTPLMVTAVQHDVKSLVVAASNLGAWHLQLQDIPGKENFFQNFVEYSLKWLVSKEDIQRIQIQPDQPSYRTGEPVQFSGQVYDEFYREIKDADVKITIEGEDFEQSDILASEAGFYSHQASGIPPGTYTYKLVATSDEREIGRRRGNFVIEELELEMQDTKANYSLMQQIAQKSGGRVWRARNFSNEIENLKFHKKIQLSNIEYVLWNQIHWLIAIIILLAVEWFLRKKWGLL